MPYIKLYFKDGIPSDTIIKSWKDAPAFENNEITINKYPDNKTISIYVEHSSGAIISHLIRFHSDFLLTWNQEVMILFMDVSDDEKSVSFYINDGKNYSSHSLSMNFSTSKNILGASTKKKIRFLRNFGFEKEFARFVFEDSNNHIVLFDNHTPDEILEEMTKS
jgi:hypothetical protein